MHERGDRSHRFIDVHLSVATACRSERYTSEPEREIANRHFIYNVEGTITDVLYTQNGSQRRLKEIIPGEYTIAFQERKPEDASAPMETLGYYYSAYNFINILPAPNAPERYINLAIFHEAGHAADYQIHWDTYKASKEELLYEEIKANIYGNLLNEKPLLYSIHRAIDYVMGQHNLPEITQDKRKVWESLFLSDSEVTEAPIVALEYLRKQMITTETNAAYLQAKREALIERRAWNIGLQAIRSLRKEGIIVAGDSTSILEHVDYALGTYEAAHGRHLRDGERILRSRKSDKNAVEE